MRVVHGVTYAGRFKMRYRCLYDRFAYNVDMDRYDRVKVAKICNALVSLHINSTGNGIPFPEHLPMCQSQTTKQIMLWKQEHLLRTK